MSRWAHVFSAALLAIALFASRSASAAPKLPLPPLVGHVVDTSGQLGHDDIVYLDGKLESFRLRSGFAIVALVVGPLQDEPIEDVAYTAFNTWQIGDKGKDDGVLIVVAPADRRVRIETGKGVGGALTDLQSNDIIRDDMSPLLRDGRLRDAIDVGADAVAKALVEGTPGAARRPPPVPAAPTVSPLTLGLAAGGILLVIILLIVSPAFRSLFFTLFQMFLIFGGRGGGGGGGGASGGSGYSGGGGRSGGGGSSDSY